MIDIPHCSEKLDRLKDLIINSEIITERNKRDFLIWDTSLERIEPKLSELLYFSALESRHTFSSIFDYILHNS